MPQTFWWFSKRDPGVRSQPALRRSAFTGGKRLLDDKKRIQERLGIATSRAEPENVERRSAAVSISVGNRRRSEEHTSELQSRENLVCRLLLEKKKKKQLRDK